MKSIQIGDIVRHGTFGIGEVMNITTDRIEVEFAAIARFFQYPSALEDNLLTLEYTKDFIDSVKRIPIVFLNIAWMKHYKGITPTDIPINGGEYVDINKSGAERNNFNSVKTVDEHGENPEDSMLGYFSTKSRANGNINQMRIENILGGNASKDDVAVDGVLVVWCATPKKGPSQVVGWCKDARLFREYQFTHEVDGDIFNVVCRAENAVLLPVDVRNEPQWQISRAANRDALFGFGQSNVWYATKPISDRFVRRMILTIETYQGENIALS